MQNTHAYRPQNMCIIWTPKFYHILLMCFFKQPKLCIARIYFACYSQENNRTFAFESKGSKVNFLPQFLIIT